MKTQKNDYEIALQVVNQMIDNFEWFTEKELVDKIALAGGILQVSPGTTLRDYLDKLLATGFLFAKLNDNLLTFIGNPIMIPNRKVKTLLKQKGIKNRDDLREFFGEGILSQNSSLFMYVNNFLLNH